MEIKFENVSYIYQPGTPYESQGLQEVSLTIPDQSYTAIIGHTGSGKSTLLQHLDGLLQPTSGAVFFDHLKVDQQSDHKMLKQLRQKVGLVFQFPESQLFEETVLKDVAFGPQNFGVSEEEALKVAREKLELVGISSDLYDRSPFELSGGQMRRVAIAGVLAMNPEVLVLDEPTAGLDPIGRMEMMRLFQQLYQTGMTIVLVTHQMDDVANFASHVIVMEGGKMIKETTPKDLFLQADWLAQHHLNEPKVVQFYRQLKGSQPYTEVPLNMDELVTLIQRNLGRGEVNE